MNHASSMLGKKPKRDRVIDKLCIGGTVSHLEGSSSIAHLRWSGFCKKE